MNGVQLGYAQSLLEKIHGSGWQKFHRQHAWAATDLALQQMQTIH